MATKRRPSRAPRQRSGTTQIDHVYDVEQTPGVWINSTKDGTSYGVRAYGKSVARQVPLAIEAFLQVKHFVEVALPEETAKNNRELLARSAEFQAKKP